MTSQSADRAMACAATHGIGTRYDDYAAPAIDSSIEGEGMRFEIAEVHRCFGEGLLEGPTMPLDETVAFAAIMDELRAQIGLVCPVDLPWQPPSRAGSAPHAAPPSSP